RSYAAHRHNAGYLVVEDLAGRAPVGFTHSLRLGADVAQTRLTASGDLGGVGDQAAKVVLMKSRTYMNDSGRAVERVAGYFGIKPESVVAVHDELDLDPGRIRLKFGGGDNGHNGLKSIRRHLGTGDFYRVRIGIGRPPGSQAPADYVLTGVPTAERESFDVDIARAGDAVLTLLSQGLEAAQNEFNS
ncbi:MAG: aminoacyl-tRNA hydrolase, partial [Propionicimonas sp.]|nr:aminoacyl-tRNA hydrolase [Propionicimonas sp.]